MFKDQAIFVLKLKSVHGSNSPVRWFFLYLDLLLLIFFLLHCLSVTFPSKNYKLTEVLQELSHLK